MTNTESVLAVLTCLVGAVCIIAAQTKKGVILGSVSSQLSETTKKYVVRSGKRKPFYIYLSVTFISLVTIALLCLRDLESIAIFVGLNLFSIGYFLSYFVLLEPKYKSK